MNIELNKQLYANRSLEIELIHAKCGKVGSAAYPVSKHRPAGTSLRGPQLSSAAIVLDFLFKNPKTLAVYESTVDNQVYVEFGNLKLLVSEKGLTVIGEDPIYANTFAAIGFVCYALSEFSELDELKNIYLDMMESIKATGTITEQQVMLFCDSFYYGFAKDSSLVLDTSPDSSVIEMAFRSGMFRQCELLRNNNYLAKSVFDSSTPIRSTTKKSNKNFFEDCKAGKYIIPYDFDEESKQCIPSLKMLESYVPIPEYEYLVTKIYKRLSRILMRLDCGMTGCDAIENDYVNVLLLGKPGTGKSILIEAVCATLGLPMHMTNISKYTDEDEVGGKTRIVDGHPQFVETDALKAHQNGGVSLLEEINLGDGGMIMSSFGQAIWKPFIVKKNGYEPVVRHPMCVYIACMNTGTNGSKETSEPLMNRFKQKPELADPTKDTFIEILSTSSGQGTDLCEYVYNAYEEVVKYLTTPQMGNTGVKLAMTLSIRTCLGAIEDIEEGVPVKKALENSIVGAISAANLDIGHKVKAEVIGRLINPKFTVNELEI